MFQNQRGTESSVKIDALSNIDGRSCSFPVYTTLSGMRDVPLQNEMSFSLAKKCEMSEVVMLGPG
jgi:hypothetical protein